MILIFTFLKNFESNITTVCGVSAKKKEKSVMFTMKTKTSTINYESIRKKNVSKHHKARVAEDEEETHNNVG